MIMVIGMKRQVHQHIYFMIAEANGRTPLPTLKIGLRLRKSWCRISSFCSWLNSKLQRWEPPTSRWRRSLMDSRSYFGRLSVPHTFASFLALYQGHQRNPPLLHPNLTFASPNKSTTIASKNSDFLWLIKLIEQSYFEVKPRKLGFSLIKTWTRSRIIRQDFMTSSIWQYFLVF